MSRQTVSLLKCDNPRCKEYVESPQSNFTPPDWIRLSIHGNGRDSNFDLCSLRCVSVWANERRKVVLPEGSHPCGICDFVSSSIQGLRAHERNAHGYDAPKEGK